MKRLGALLVIVSIVLVVGAGAYVATRAARDPARELFGQALPSWQTLRLRPGSKAGTSAEALAAVSAIEELARPWPEVARDLSLIVEAWPDEDKVRAAARSLNVALRDASLPYFVDVQHVQKKPVLLTYVVGARVPWRLDEKSVDVLRISRLDHLNIEMGLFGQSDGTQPVVFLDRIEARLAADLLGPAWGKERGGDDGPSVQTSVDKLVLARLRRLLEERAGKAALGASVELLARRDHAFDVMRARLRNGTVHIERPDRFVYGDEWFDELGPYARIDRPGGPLILEGDVRTARAADEALRADDAQAPLLAVVDLLAASTEAHEARHALDPDSREPPPALLAELDGDDPDFARLAEHELRAYLGELHDAPGPACLSIAEMVQALWGSHVALTPHYFAKRVILGELGGRPLDDDPASGPPALLERLCALPDAELRRRAAEAWLRLYGSPLISSVRGATGAGVAIPGG